MSALGFGRRRRVDAAVFACGLASSACWVLVLVLMAPAEARAQTVSTPAVAPVREHPRFAIEALTEFPVSVGLRADAELPHRLRVSTSVGFLPGPYVDAINGLLTTAGAYPDTTADLIKSTLKSSLVWRTHVGVRPFRNRGFYVDAGYGLVALGGSATAATLVAGVTGQTLPAEDNAETKAFQARSTLHMLDVEVGWQLWIHDHVRLRVALGGAFTLAASTSIAPDYTPRAPRVTASFANYAQNYLNDVMTSYVFTPVLTVGGGWGF
jgi:hypothetical protein